MSRRNLLILALLLFTVGVMLVIGNSGVLNQPKKNDQVSINEVVQKAAQDATGGQTFRDAADVILGGAETQTPVTENINKANTSSTSTDSFGSGEASEYRVAVAKSAIDEASLSKYKVDALLDGSNVYHIVRDQISDEAVNVQLDKVRCFLDCLLIRTPDDWMNGNGSYYLSSFKKNGDVLWIAFYKTDDGYTYAEISKPRFTDKKRVNFTDDKVTNIFQKDSVNGIYLIETNKPDLFIIDFKLDIGSGDD